MLLLLYVCVFQPRYFDKDEIWFDTTSAMDKIGHYEVQTGFICHYFKFENWNSPVNTDVSWNFSFSSLYWNFVQNRW